jgi:hypothetical protein
MFYAEECSRGILVLAGGWCGADIVVDVFQRDTSQELVSGDSLEVEEGDRSSRTTKGIAASQQRSAAILVFRLVGCFFFFLLTCRAIQEVALEDDIVVLALGERGVLIVLDVIIWVNLDNLEETNLVDE